MKKRTKKIKAKALLIGLENLKLLRIRKAKLNTDLASVLKKFRNKADKYFNLEKITLAE